MYPMPVRVLDFVGCGNPVDGQYNACVLTCRLIWLRVEFSDPVFFKPSQTISVGLSTCWSQYSKLFNSLLAKSESIGDLLWNPLPLKLRQPQP